MESLEKSKCKLIVKMMWGEIKLKTAYFSNSQLREIPKNNGPKYFSNSHQKKKKKRTLPR